MTSASFNESSQSGSRIVSNRYEIFFFLVKSFSHNYFIIAHNFKYLFSSQDTRVNIPTQDGVSTSSGVTKKSNWEVSTYLLLRSQLSEDVLHKSPKKVIRTTLGLTHSPNLRKEIGS